MRGVIFTEFGGPEVLHLVDLPGPPPPGDREVAVDIVASTVNPTDCMMRSGQQAALMSDLPPPWIAGMEFSGHIAAAGHEAGLSVGTPVIGVVNPRRASGGAYAARIVTPAASVAAIGPGTDLVGAATVPMNALTALLALEMLALDRGATLLVTGGAGMLGGSVIALAKAAGLKVLANAAPADSALLRGLGADEILPRSEGLSEALRASCPAGVDGLVDGALIGQTLAPLVRNGGGAISLRRSHPISDPRLKVGYVGVNAGMERQDLLARIAAALRSGVLAPRVAPRGIFPAARAVEAHRMAEAGGFRGRIVISFAT
jgi:NADPH:quinone reductase